MFTTLIVLLAVIAVAFAGHDGSKISASVKDNAVNGIEGLNVNIQAPFKFQDYVVGFNYALGSLKKAPESLFARRSFNTAGDGSVSLDAEYTLDDKVLSVSSTWNSDDLGLSLQANADTNERLKSVGLTKQQNVNGNKLTVGGVYDLLKSKFKVNSHLNVDDTNVNVAYDSEDQDPVLSVSRRIDDNNEVEPSISLKTGEISYGWKRKWDGGSLRSKFFPGDKVEVEWNDQGAGGSWTTTAEMPINNLDQTKVSFSRDWDY